MTFNKFLQISIVFLVIFAWIFSGWPRIWQNPAIPPEIQKIEAATIPSGVIVAWPSTAGLIPSGWSRVTALDATYVRGVPNASTDPGTTGGSATHQHTTSAHDHTISHTQATATSGNATGSVTAGTTSTADLQTTTHTHATNAIAATVNNSGTASPSSGATSNDPAYLKVIWIESNGNPTGIPNGALAMFSTTSLPGSWAIYTNSQDRFLKGADALGDGGATGGAATHNHTGEGSHTHTSDHVHPDGTTAQSAATNNAYAAGATACGDNHTHTYTVSSNNFGTSNTATLNTSTDNHEPPWQKVAIIENQTGGVSAPAGVIAVWRGTLANIPPGWVLADGNNGTPNLLSDFVKGAANTGEIGNTGGTTSHTHTGSNHTHTWASTAHTHTVNITGACSVPRGTAGTTATWASPTHTHTVTSGAASAITPGNAAPNLNSATHLPPYEEVAYIMLLPVVDTPAYDNGTGTYNNDVSVTITVASPASSTICYTTNGDTPAATTPGTCSTGSTYSGPVSIIATGTVLKAIGTKAGYTNSAVQSATYTLTVGAISSVPGPGTYSSTQSVTLNIATTTGAVGHYTTNGDEATCSSTTYSAPFDVSTTTTVKAIGCKTNYVNDTPISDLYTINTNSAPAFSGNPTDSPDPVVSGHDVTFSGTATDSESNNWYLAVCKTDSITPGTPPTCDTSQDYCVSTSAVGSGSENTCIWTSTGSTAQDWYAFACDDNISPLCSSKSNNNSPITVNSAVISVTIDPTTTSYGVMPTNNVKKADTANANDEFIVTNNSTNVAEDFEIIGSDATNGAGWTLSPTSTGSSIFMHAYSTLKTLVASFSLGISGEQATKWVALDKDPNYRPLATNVDINGTVDLILELLSPTDIGGGDYGVTKSTTVTIRASEHLTIICLT